MWRDRTNLYISYRQSYAHHPSKKTKYSFPTNGYSANLGGPSEEHRGLMSAGAYDNEGDAVIEMDLLPPRWVDVSDEVTEYLKHIGGSSQKLEKLHQKHVLPGFDDEDVKRREEEEIERLTQDITKGFHLCQKAIERVTRMVKESKAQDAISKGEEAMAKNLQISLAGRVQEASAVFRKKQSAYLKKLRDFGGTNPPKELTGTASYSNYTDPLLLETDADKSYSQSTLQQATQKQIPSNDVAITQREREITDIAQGIIELADIFKDLQRLVIDQGTMLDRIDYNVERMATDVRAADKELKIASGYQRKGTKRKLIFLLVLLVIGMFILLIVKPKKHSKQVEDTVPPL